MVSVPESLILPGVMSVNMSLILARFDSKPGCTSANTVHCGNIGNAVHSESGHVLEKSVPSWCPSFKRSKHRLHESKDTVILLG